MRRLSQLLAILALLCSSLFAQCPGGVTAPACGVINLLGVIDIQTSLTSAQILALNTTPVLLIPSPGPGKFINIISVQMEYLFGGTAYTDGGGTAFSVIYGTALANVVYSVTATPFVTTGVNQLALALPVTTSAAGSVSYALSVAVNQPVSVRLGAALTLGNGTVKIFLQYTIENS